MSDEAKVEALEPEQPSPEVVEAHEPARAERAELLPPRILALAWKVIPTAWILGAIVAGLMSGPPLALLVLASGALTLIVTLMWSSIQSLTGGAPLGFEEALGMGAPSKVEEEKRAVLRALKDLEYERSVGKISPDDYAELSLRYRSEAKRLMQSVDEALGPARAEVEKAIVERLQRVGVAAQGPDDASTEPATFKATKNPAPSDALPEASVKLPDLATSPEEEER